ncbi:Os06g0726600, partial [Oryza sativa Japonica Group]
LPIFTSPSSYKKILRFQIIFRGWNCCRIKRSLVRPCPRLIPQLAESSSKQLNTTVHLVEEHNPTSWCLPPNKGLQYQLGLVNYDTL